MSNIHSILTEDAAHEEILRTAGRLGQQLKIPTYVVGGYVRDKLLNRFSKDIDIMVEGDGIAFAKKLTKKLGVGSIVEYETFGTALIPHPELDIEVASARKESYNSNSRKPHVEISTLDEDLSRRDFTINSMAASILPDTFGDLVDPYGGIKDLHKQIIITPLDPDETFSDDPLRMLRALRFSAQLDFKVASNILDSISRQKDRISIISWERITEEIKKILSTDKPSTAFYHLKETGLLKYVFPELDVMSGVEIIDGMGHKDVFIHTLQVVDNAAKLTEKMEIRFAALVHDIAKPPTKRFHKKKGWSYHGHEILGMKMLKKVAKRMKLSNELRGYLMIMTKLHLRPIALAKKEITDSAVRRVMLEAGDCIDDLMILCRSDITTKNPHKVKKYINNFNRVEELMQDVKLRDEMKAFQSPIRGDEIMSMYNIQEGRAVGKIKNAIEEAILEGEIKNTYEDALSYMEKIKSKFI